MEACDKAGEMVTIEQEVDWNLEAGAISPAHHRDRRADGIHEEDARRPRRASVLASPLAKGWHNDFSRIAIALGLDPKTPFEPLMDQFIQRMNNPIRPLQVRRPVQGEHPARRRDQPVQLPRALPP